MKNSYAKSILLSAYLMSLIVLALVIPHYGDPSNHVRTALNIGIIGAPLDQVCNCVRSPLYYYLIYATYPIHKAIQPLLFLPYCFLTMKTCASRGYPSSLWGLLLPPLYIMGTRAYVDTLVLTLYLTFTYIVITKPADRKSCLAIGLATSSLILSREIAVLLIFLFVASLTLVRAKDLERKVACSVVGYGVGLMVYVVYIISTRFKSWFSFILDSSTRVHVSSDAFYSLFSSLIVTQFHFEDFEYYLRAAGIAQPLLSYQVYQLAMCIIIVTSSVIAFSFHLGLVRTISELFKRTDGSSKFLLLQVIFGIIVSIIMVPFFSSVDYFRVTVFLISFSPLFVGYSLEYKGGRGLIHGVLLKSSLLFMYILWILRSLRLALQQV